MVTTSYQHGTALVMAMLVLLLVMILISPLVLEQRITTRRGDYLMATDRAWQLALAGENWAKGQLQDVITNHADMNHTARITLPQTALNGGNIKVDLHDLQGRFNLNNLVVDGIPIEKEWHRLKRLLNTMELTSTWVTATLDWIQQKKSDRNTLLVGQNTSFAKLTQRLSSPSELFLVEPFFYHHQARLMPLLCALPAANVTINVNSAPVELLMALISDLSRQGAQDLIDERQRSPFTTTDAFLNHQLLKGKKVDIDGIGLSSQHFASEVIVKVDNVQINLISHLTISGERVVVLRRAQDIL